MRCRLGFVGLAVLLTSLASAQAPVVSYVRTLGGSWQDSVAGIATDPAGNVYVAGTTSSPDFPTQAGLRSSFTSSPLFRIDTGTAYVKLPPGIPADITSLAADQQTPGVIYAVSAFGAFKSSDRGATWQVFPSAASSIAYSAVGRLTVDPTNSNVLYASVTTAATGNWPALYKSLDGGFSWQLLSTAATGVLAIDPNTSSTLFGYYAPMSGGPWRYLRSGDGGQTWMPLPMDAFNFSFLKKTPGTVYGTGYGAPWKSIDGGQTWTQLPMPQFLPQVIPVVLADPNQAGTIYVASQGGLLKSTDDGQTWTTITVQPTIAQNGGAIVQLAADPVGKVIYAATSTAVYASSNSFQTWTQVTPTDLNQVQTLAMIPGVNPSAAGSLLVGTQMSSDIFVAKYDPQGNLLYSTLLGGTSNDTATAIAVDAQGNAYVTGLTTSSDFPVSASAYQSAITANYLGKISSFLAKLSPDGSTVVYSTYFAGAGSSVAALALDSAGNAYLAGTSFGGLPTTVGVVQPQFGQYQLSCCTMPFGWDPQNAFVSKFSADGSTLLYSTYLGLQSDAGYAVAVASDGSAYVGGSQLWKLSADASTLLFTRSGNSFPRVRALTLDSAQNLYVAGSASWAAAMSANAFQSGPPRPNLQYEGDQGSYANGHPYVAKLDPKSGNTLYATFVAGSSANIMPAAVGDVANAIAVDSAGNAVVVGTTISTDFPLRIATQGPFAGSTSWIAKLNQDGSNLLYSTYSGDNRPFAAVGVALDTQGNPVLAGFTVNTSNGAQSLPPGMLYPASPSSNVLLARFDTSAPPPAVRLDNMLNAASLLGGASPGSLLTIRGAGFGSQPSVFFKGEPGQVFSSTGSVIQTMVPTELIPGAIGVQVQAMGQTSNSAWLQVTPYAPAIFTQTGGGAGDGMIFNADGTMNSSTNPAAVGSLIHIITTGLGFNGILPRMVVLVGGYPVGIPECHFTMLPGIGPALEITAGIPKAYNMSQISLQLQINDPSDANAGSTGTLSPLGVAVYVAYP